MHTFRARGFRPASNNRFVIIYTIPNDMCYYQDTEAKTELPNEEVQTTDHEETTTHINEIENADEEKTETLITEQTTDAHLHVEHTEDIQEESVNVTETSHEHEMVTEVEENPNKSSDEVGEYLMIEFRFGTYLCNIYLS